MPKSPEDEQIAQSRRETVSQPEPPIGDKKTAKTISERAERLSDFMPEGRLDVDAFLKKFPDAMIVWFGKIAGGVRKQIEEPRIKLGLGVGYYVPFNIPVIHNKKMADDFIAEIRNNLKYDGWDKFYVCVNQEIAEYLASKIE